jgi:hypothetical protein
VLDLVKLDGGSLPGPVATYLRGLLQAMAARDLQRRWMGRDNARRQAVPGPLRRVELLVRHDVDIDLVPDDDEPLLIPSRHVDELRQHSETAERWIVPTTR